MDSCQICETCNTRLVQYSGSFHPEFIVIAYGGTLFCTRTDQTLICECYLVFVYKRDNIIMLVCKPYTCTLCGLYLHCFDRMKQHVKKHKLKYRRTSRSLKMNTLSNNYTLQVNTITLMKDGTYLCEVCRKRFLRECDLTKHIYRTHTKETPYQCQVCQKCFSQQYMLTRHIRTHTKEKPYQCEYCQKYFSQKYNLTQHIITHTKEKPYQCEVCRKCFSRKSDLTRHLRTHTKYKPYTCEVCQKCFSHSLTQHMRTHTKEKPYQCEVCRKRFSQQHDLTRHIRTHTKEKPYQCQVCQKCFSQRGTLKKHIRTHTKVTYQCSVLMIFNAM